MSIVMNCQYCGEPEVCYEHQVENDKPVFICDGYAEEATKCTRCGVITDYYEYDEMGFIECCDCLEKEHQH